MKAQALCIMVASSVAFLFHAAAQNTNQTPGFVISWGEQVIPYVAPGTSFTNIAAGGEHSLALKSDGTMVPWGNNGSGQSRVPAGLSNVVAIAAGWFHSLAIQGQQNTPPVANPGPDRVVYAWIDGIAEVTLDGSGSSDADGDQLTYLWTWSIDRNTYQTNDVKPTIELPVGEHVIQLIVNDGIVDSELSQVVVTVVGPVAANLCMTPKVLNCRNRGPRIMAMMRLPEGITKDQIDTNQPILLYPGAIDAVQTRISRGFDECRVLRATIFAWFDKDEVISAIPDNGPVELVVVGQLNTGQYFFGSDTVRVICPGHWPGHRHWADQRWNRRCRGLVDFRH